jgi:hypothetical protein
LKEFLSKDTNVLYIPFLSHPSLKELRIQTFFHLCRLENISFDIKRKIGNVFMFLKKLSCEFCLNNKKGSTHPNGKSSASEVHLREFGKPKTKRIMKVK